jgi:hypothetical protein
MLDGRDEKKSYSAVKINEYSDGKQGTLTMHFTAFDDEDARRFLKEGGYDGYELILTEKL